MEESSVREEKFRIGKNSSEEVEEKLTAFVFYPCLQRPYKIELRAFLQLSKGTKSHSRKILTKSEQ